MDPTRQQLQDALDTAYARSMTMTEKGAALGVSDETVRRMVAKGKLEAVKFGREVRVWADA